MSSENKRPGGAESATGIRFFAYEMADQNFRRNAFEAVRRAEPFLGKIDLVESDHTGPIRSVGGAKPFDSPMRLQSAIVSIKIADIEQMNFSGYLAMISEANRTFLEAFAKLVFGDLGELVAHVGNVVDGNGRSLFEQFKEGVMKVAHDFDDDGNLIQKQLVVPPEKFEEAREAMEAVWRDPEVIAHVTSEREKFITSRGQRRLLSPC